jgi:hypothetical protein
MPLYLHSWWPAALIGFLTLLNSLPALFQG